MCDFCDIYKIETREEYQKAFKDNWYDCCGTHLIKEPDGTLSIFTAVDDYFYNHTVVENVKYCPCCGRSLV